MFTSCASRSLSGLFVAVSGCRPEAPAVLLAEFWDSSPPPPNTDGFVIGKEIATCGFLHHRCFRASLRVALVLTRTRWGSHSLTPALSVVFYPRRGFYAQTQ